MAKLAITLKKSTIGFPRNQRRTVASLGLRRLHQTAEHDDTPVTLGMVRKVQHLLDVQEVAES
jgi:large subunit ribosomal protein L30